MRCKNGRMDQRPEEMLGFIFLRPRVLSLSCVRYRLRQDVPVSSQISAMALVFRIRERLRSLLGIHRAFRLDSPIFLALSHLKATRGLCSCCGCGQSLFVKQPILFDLGSTVAVVPSHDIEPAEK
ncbi:hypothetical protein BDW74DRAFT_132262 [Aspergillus multicolor]|uniref:uncharacterized protein n=1 Tax=Aspergillus multicolor TaxID=41759 RepID=UPI003CCCF575